METLSVSKAALRANVLGWRGHDCNKWPRDSYDGGTASSEQFGQCMKMVGWRGGTAGCLAYRSFLPFLYQKYSESVAGTGRRFCVADDLHTSGSWSLPEPITSSRSSVNRCPPLAHRLGVLPVRVDTKPCILILSVHNHYITEVT